MLKTKKVRSLIQMGTIYVIDIMSLVSTICHYSMQIWQLQP